MGYNENEDQDFMYDFASEYGNSDNTSQNWATNLQLQGNSFQQNANIISGTNIVEAEEDGEALNDMLKDFNAHNTGICEEEEKRLRAEQEAREEADRLMREQAREKLLQERYEEEKKEREKIRLAEEEEERRLAEEMEAKRKANPFFRMKELATNAAKEAATNRAAKEEENKKKKEAEEKKPVEEKKEAPAKEKQNPEPKKEKPKKEKPKKESKKDETNSQPDFEFLATHDKLTGIKNLTAYEMAVQKCNTNKLAILFFDVNDLKEVNDTLGHAIGNKLINITAQALEELFPNAGYRIGGDEFVVLYEVKKLGDVQKDIENKINKFQLMMKEATENDADGLTYSVSVGYAIGDGKKTVAEIQDEADKAMYAHKQAYKSSKKKTNTPKTPQKKENTPPPDYDSLLSDEQRMLKTVIKDNHNQASEESTEKILREIQSRYNDIVAILVASPTFDHLFIMQNVESFVDMVIDMENLIDYSYLYVVYENGTQFYGIDEYFDEVTVLFTEIGKVIKSSPYVSDKELLKIKGINVFKHIYFD